MSRVEPRRYTDYSLPQEWQRYGNTVRRTRYLGKCKKADEVIRLFVPALSFYLYNLLIPPQVVASVALGP